MVGEGDVDEVTAAVMARREKVVDGFTRCRAGLKCSSQRGW